jgi:hypothetical protein
VLLLKAPAEEDEEDRYLVELQAGTTQFTHLIKGIVSRDGLSTETIGVPV